MGPLIAVVGASVADEALEASAAVVGRLLAEAGANLICGGLGGVMAGACRGAREAGGMTIGLLPGEHRNEANPWVQVAIPTGLGELRNGLLVRAADAVVAIGGGYGTLSEIALALRIGRPVVGLNTWEFTGPDQVADTGVVRVVEPADAVRRSPERTGAG